jgi:hypothetical protein
MGGHQDEAHLEIAHSIVVVVVVVVVAVVIVHSSLACVTVNIHVQKT